MKEALDNIKSMHQSDSKLKEKIVSAARKVGQEAVNLAIVKDPSELEKNHQKVASRQ